MKNLEYMRSMGDILKMFATNTTTYFSKLHQASTSVPVSSIDNDRLVP